MEPLLEAQVVLVVALEARLPLEQMETPRLLHQAKEIKVVMALERHILLLLAVVEHLLLVAMRLLLLQGRVETAQHPLLAELL